MTPAAWYAPKHTYKIGSAGLWLPGPSPSQWLKEKNQWLLVIPQLPLIPLDARAALNLTVEEEVAILGVAPDCQCLSQVTDTEDF